MREQRTLSRPFRLTGTALHSGAPSTVAVEPAAAGRGLVFVREDLGGVEIPALQQFRAPMLHATKLERDGVQVDTPEHLLAALLAFAVDNAVIRLSAAELPILDGSSLPYVHAILESGTVPQGALRPRIVVTRSIVVNDDDRCLEIHPFDGLKLTGAIDFEHQQLGFQKLTIRLDEPDDFVRKLAPARTFALKRDVEYLQKMGLVRGGSLDNAVVVDDDGVMGSGLRFADEFVRHKLLDLVGDMALAGCDLAGRIVAWRSGHALHGRLLDAILSNGEAWIYESGDASSEGPVARAMPPGRAKPA